MITKQYNKPHVLWQSAEEGGYPNAALALSVDAGGTICISQEGNDICLNKETIHELCKLLKKLAE